MFPLGLAADTVRASQQKDRWVMDSLDSSLWTWTAVTGCVIHQKSVSKNIPQGYPLFSKRSRTGQMKIQSIDPGKPAYLSHWVITHVSASGEPLEATGLLHCLRLEEKVEKAEASAEIAKMETATIRSRINPHLLFNCLTGLRALIQRNPSRARDFITLLAKFLRTAVDSQLNTLIPIEQEFALCRQYLELENMRGKRTSFKVTIPTRARSLRIPPMSIQTLVENAVKHGKYSSKRTLWIRISARLGTDKKLVVSVSQPGNLHSFASKKDTAGIALVRHHLALMYHQDGSLDVREKRKGVVTATITFPIGSNLG
jgi:LytS/YehU family sensor histidine kinase